MLSGLLAALLISAFMSGFASMDTSGNSCSEKEECDSEIAVRIMEPKSNNRSVASEECE